MSAEAIAVTLVIVGIVLWTVTSIIQIMRKP